MAHGHGRCRNGARFFTTSSFVFASVVLLFTFFFTVNTARDNQIHVIISLIRG